MRPSGVGQQIWYDQRLKMRGRLALVSVHNSLEHDRMTKFTYVHPYALSHPLAI